MGELNFGRLLRRTTRLFHDQPALNDLGDGYQATYEQHLERVGRVCAVLAGLGIGPWDRFGVLAGGSHHYIELWHAALTGGGVINPLNTRLASEELVYILDDSETEVILVDATFAPVIDAIRPRLPKVRCVVMIGGGEGPCDVRLDELLAAAASTGLPPEPEDDDPAVLMYTGGTTGLPKGVLLSHAAVTLVVYRMVLEARFPLRSRYLAFMPLFHIGGVGSWGLLIPSGGYTVIMPGFDPGAAAHAVREHQITVMAGVPTMFGMMLRHPEFEPSMLDTVDILMYGAAPMPADLLDKLLELRPDLDFIQAYGMTECASTVTNLTADDHRKGGAILRSVGRALVGVEIDIRDPVTAEPRPQGGIGEIWIRCGSAMLEYWRKPEQTAASLVDGWYRSGDAGHLDPDGYLFLADRVKDMIVSGAENVYSLEVENAINTHPAVVQVAVIGVPDEVWGERVHAVVVCEPGSVTADELDAYARQTIAGFKVPKTWTFQTEPLPLSAAAKVLKRDLRERVAAEERAAGAE